MFVTKIEVFELKGYGKIHYSDKTSLIVSIKSARSLSETYDVCIQEGV